jgi:branched-chain amino acid transport system substrate-binding protein
MTRQLDETRAHERFNGAHQACLPYNLSPREWTVLREIAKGLSDFEIAESLGITKFTVNKHVGAILAKMNVASRTAAAVRAIREHVA